jgi:hypothetical protein
VRLARHRIDALALSAVLFPASAFSQAGEEELAKLANPVRP